MMGRTFDQEGNASERRQDSDSFDIAPRLRTLSQGDLRMMLASAMLEVSTGEMSLERATMLLKDHRRIFNALAKGRNSKKT